MRVEWTDVYIRLYKQKSFPFRRLSWLAPARQLAGECILYYWRAEARSKPTVICLGCWSYKAIGRTVSCEAKLTFRGFALRVAHDDRKRRVSLLFGSLRCKTPPSTSSPPWWRRASGSSAVSDSRRCSSIHHQLSLVGFCKS